MAEQEHNRSELRQRDRGKLLRYAIWNDWRKRGGAHRPFVDLPSVDDGRDSSSESDKDQSSSESSESSSSEESVYVGNSAPGNDGVVGCTSAHSSDYCLKTDFRTSTDFENANDKTTGNPGSVERWSTMDGTERSDECPCCIASTSCVSESREQSRIVTFFQDPAIKRAQIKEQIRERSKRCQVERQQLLRTALWNSWCAKNKALCQEEQAFESIPDSNLTNVVEEKELPALPDAVAHRDSECSPEVTEKSNSRIHSSTEDSTSESSDCASSGSSDWSEDDDWVNAHFGFQELSSSFSSGSLSGYARLLDSSCGTSSNESNFGWSDWWLQD